MRNNPAICFHRSWCVGDAALKPPCLLTCLAVVLPVTTVAYMYDLCLKRLTRKARQAANTAANSRSKTDRKESESECECVDPHEHIQRVLLSAEAMPALRYFISTYSPQELQLGQDKDSDNSSRRLSSDNTWRLVLQKKLPCSTDSYMFYAYERVPLVDIGSS